MEWIEKIQAEYPEFRIYGNPETHYNNISNNIGHNYFVSKTGLDNLDMTLYKSINNNFPPTKDWWKVTILGNPVPDGTKFGVLLIKPINRYQSGEILQPTEFPAFAFSSEKGAYTYVCGAIGKCGDQDKGWSRYIPDPSKPKPPIIDSMIEKYGPLSIYINEFTVNNNDFVFNNIDEFQHQNERSRKSFTHRLKEILNIATVNHNTLPVGSFRYSAHKYPGDIDIMERLNYCCDINRAAEEAAKDIQKIIYKIKASKDVYLGDFKAGRDNRYNINIGGWENGRLVRFNPTVVEQKIKSLRTRRLITKKDLSDLMKTYKKLMSNPSEENLKSLSDALRPHEVLRWNSEEIIQGFKYLPGAETLSLVSAIQQKTVVKIDLWAKMNLRKYIEVTNYFLIHAIDKNGNVKFTLTQDMPDYIEAVSQDVIHYSQPENLNTLKALKRLWSLSLRLENYDLVKRINPILSSNEAGLSQIQAEIEVVSLMLVKLPNPPMSQIMEQIDGFKPRIDRFVKDSEINVNSLYKLCDEITGPFFYHKATYDEFDSAIEYLEKLDHMIGEIIQKGIFKLAQKLGISDPTSFL